MKKQFYFATWLRVAAAISILLCHFLSQSKNGLLGMLAQFFSIGVELFVILSGFLFGTREGETENTGEWYKKRLKRIFVPYEFFVVFLFCVHVVCGADLLNQNWIWLALGLQGTVVGVLGAEQTWFITPLLICYAITPLLDRFFCQTREKWKIKALLAITASVPLLWAVPKAPTLNTLLSPVSCYIVAFAVGRYRHNNVLLTRTRAVAAFFVMTAAAAIRLAARYLCDGTVVYDRIVCGYTQAGMAFCIFYIFAVMFERVQPVRIVQKAAEISFEVYLFHYMFCVGPVRLFGVTPFWTINCLLITLVTVMLAAVAHALSGVIIRILR